MSKRILIIILMSMILGLTQTSAHSQPSLKILTEEWPPYNYIEDGEIKGFSVEIIQAIIKQLNHEYKIQLLPGARGERMLRTEKNIMSFSLFRTKKRENKFKWIGPISDDAVYFYKKKDYPLSIKTLEDAKKVNLITSFHKGLVYDMLIENGFTNLSPVSNHLSSIKKVLKGRVSLGVNLTPLGIKYYLRKAQLPQDAIELTSVKIVDFPLYIAASRDISDETIKQWQKALNEIKASGEYDKIYNKYMK